jgi:hypothetical protein
MPIIKIEKWKSEGYIEKKFLNDHELNQAINLLDKINLDRDEKVITRNKLNKNGLGFNSLEKYCKKIEKKYEPYFKNMLKKLAPEKANIPSRLTCGLSVLPANSNYEIHEDKVEKILSGIVYLTKEKNIGTLIHNSKKDKKPDEIQWEENKLFLFSSRYVGFWHSYRSNQKKRYTMNLNLVTDRKFLHLKSQKVGYLKSIIMYFNLVTIKKLKKIIYNFINILRK